MTAVYLFDIDGTLADCSHRLAYIQKEPKDWDGFFAECPADAPIKHMVDLLTTLYDADATIVYVTGRPTIWLDDTMKWLVRHGCPEATIYMRANGDHRDDTIVKSELVDSLIKDGYRPIMAFEDRARVVKMLRARGIPCAQVAEGEF